MALDVISYAEARRAKKSVSSAVTGIRSYSIDQANNRLVIVTNDGNTLYYQFQQPKDGKDGKDGANGADGARGADGRDGANGVSPSVKVKTNNSTTYVLTITDKNGTFDTPNLKGAKGADGATGSGGRFDVNSLTRDDIIKLRELLNITSELPDIEEPQTTFVTFEFADNGNSTDELYVTFEGVEPNMSIEDDGNLYLEYEGVEPNMFIDEDGNMILED